MDNEEFLHWFAGFFAGEGCLCLTTRHRGASFAVKAMISLRGDDADILFEIQDRLGLGKVYWRKPNRWTPHPMATWEVVAIEECRKLADIFRQFPLRAKKAKELDAWEQAIIELLKPREYRSRIRLLHLKEQLHFLKRYDDEMWEPQEDIGEQLRLFETDES